MYHLNDDISKVACDAYSHTAYTNPLHADVFPGINKMEAEIVRMTVNLFHGDDECCGTVSVAILFPWAYLGIFSSYFLFLFLDLKNLFVESFFLISIVFLLVLLIF